MIPRWLPKTPRLNAKSEAAGNNNINYFHTRFALFSLFSQLGSGLAATACRCSRHAPAPIAGLFISLVALRFF